MEAYNNSVCIFVKCDGFEFPITVDDAKKLIEDLQSSIENISSTSSIEDKK